MSNRPRVSIGMPVYNGEKYIGQALDSILAQTYQNMEIIVSDNASTDRTAEICKRYASDDTRINFIQNERNLGAAPNYNRVFQISSGRYFKWAAHDDFIAPTFLEKCVNILEANPRIVVCYSKGYVVDKEGDLISEYDPEPDLTGLKPPERFRQFICTSYLNIQMSGLMRSDVLRKTGMYGSYPASDEVLSAELSLHGEFYVIPERLFFIRLHPEQSTFGILSPASERKKFSQRDRISWFNTENETKITFPTWEYLFDSVRAVQWAPIGLSERISCYAILLRREIKPDRLRALSKDILLAIIGLAKRSYRKFVYK